MDRPTTSEDHHVNEAAPFLTAERDLWSRYGITPTERRVTLRGRNDARVQEVGDGPPVLFLHGTTVAGSSWVLLANALKDDFRCLLVDRPGCGLSDPIPNGPLTTSTAFKQFVDELTPDILDGLGLDTAHVACTSMGAFFGFRAAMTSPERVTKLVSYSWAMGSPMAKVPMMMRLGSPRPMKAMMNRLPIGATALRSMLKQVGMKRAIETGSFDDDMLAWMLTLLKHTDTLRSETDNNTFVSLRGANPDYLFTDDELRRVDMPVLLLWGDEDTNAGEREARAFAARLPNATLGIVREAGHAPWIDEPDFCATQTREFLLCSG